MLLTRPDSAKLEFKPMIMAVTTSHPEAQLRARSASAASPPSSLSP
jgi:hypothetical protein